MKIVQALGWYFPDSLGGTEVYVHGLARRLQAAGHEVQVAAPAPGQSGERTYEHDGVRVYRYPIAAQPTRAECQGRVRVRGAEHFHAWLAAQRPDVVHVHALVTGLGLHELGAARAAGARVIYTNHLGGSLGYLCQRGTLMRWGTTPCDGVVRRVKCAACISQQRGLSQRLAWAVGALPLSIARIAERLPGRFGTALGMPALIARARVAQRALLEAVDHFVLLNRWALETVAADGAPRQRLVLNRLGVSHAGLLRKPGPDEQPTAAPIRIGFLGRMVAIKGVLDLTRAVASLPAELPLRVELRGPAGDPDMLRELQHRARRDPRLAVLPALPIAEVPAQLTAYDVLCCPSSSFENGPTVALEAHAVGTPVIGTRIGGLAEIVDDGVNGRLVPPGDWRALADVLHAIATDPHGTVDRWRRALPPPRTMDEITADYLPLYGATP